MTRNILDQIEVKHYFNYDNVQGKLINNFSRGNSKIGKTAGRTDSNGYRRLSVNNKFYSEHVLIWIYHYGIIPEHLEVDHINGIRDDNRIHNLRLIPHVWNMQNQKITIGRKSYSDIPGVIYEKRSNKFRIRLMIDDVYRSFGSFDDVKEAEKKCIELRRIHYPGNTI